MHSSSLSITALAMAIGAVLAVSGSARAQSQNSVSGPVACENLAAVRVANTEIASAEFIAAGAFIAPGGGGPGGPANFSQLPEFCRVAGSIQPTSDSDIRFELWLPSEGWNGRFMQTGNGGAAGSIVYGSLAEPLARGYAVANTDTGHQGGGGDFSWAAGHPEKLIDYQYRAVHELTVAGKAITAAHFGAAPEKSYWNGCSTGGRQGLVEAQRYPEDYDAIIAGAPASNWVPLMSLSILIQSNMGPNGLGADKLGMLKESAIAACDLRDGVADRVITNPGICDFDPVDLQCGDSQTAQCLSAQEVTATQRIYSGLVNDEGEVVIPGTGPGSEPLWAAYASPQFSIGTNYYRNVVLNDSDWDPATFDISTHLVRAEQVDRGASSAMDPDLSAFIERGGKLITYHGTTDGLIPYGNSVNYYESVVEELGADTLQDSVKFFPVPGMDHCAGGEGAFAVDWLSAMEVWVEEGDTPGALLATHPGIMPGPPGASSAITESFTRPVCAYPLAAVYKGAGDSTDAENYECLMQ